MVLNIPVMSSFLTTSLMLHILELTQHTSRSVEAGATLTRVREHAGFADAVTLLQRRQQDASLRWLATRVD